MNIFPTIGRRNGGSSNDVTGQQGYALVPLRAGQDQAERERTPVDNDDRNDDDNNAQDWQDAAVPPPPAARPATAQVALQQEQFRRQQIIRLGLIACMIFFLLDGNTYNVKPDLRANSSKKLEESMDEIHLSSWELSGARTVLLPLRTTDFSSANATGMFKGQWTTYIHPEQEHNRSVSKETGSIVLTMKTLPIHDLPDLAFTYGLARVYSPKLKAIDLMSYPMQGLIVASEKKMLMFSTPYKTQQLLLQLHTPTTSTAQSSQHHSSSVQSSTTTERHHDLIETAAEGHSYRIYSSSSTVSPTAPELRMFVWDSALGEYNTSAWNNNATQTWTVGEKQLSVRFKYFQKSRPRLNFGPPVKKSLSLLGNSEEAPAWNSRTSPATLHSDCYYALELNLGSRSTETLWTPSTETTDTSNSEQDQEEEAEKEEDKLLELHRDALHSSGGVHVTPVTKMGGAMQGFYQCAGEYTFSAASYEKEYDKLHEKVEIYSLIYLALCLVQVVCLVNQIKFASTQALAAKLSLFGVLAQALLDAVICMGHLLLGTGLSSLFFASFIWIALLKLILFSFLEMRLTVNIYQARFAQELSAEGWQGFRSRLITMHLRFYGVVLFILLFGFSIPISPWIIVLVLYSHWWPQIVHNVVQGTKHALHPSYLYGMTLTRLFLPLYLMGCPQNFLVKLWEYFSPSGHLSPDSQILSESACYFLVLWLSLQVLILTLQSHYGPRFFVPKRFLPQRYDYHRPLPATLRVQLGLPNEDNSSSHTAADDGDLGDIETGSLLHSSSSNNSNTDADVSSNGSSAGNNTTSQQVECIICYNPIHLHHARDQYMITPCDHLFHTECLQTWMRVKLECPVCRAACPAQDEDN